MPLPDVLAPKLKVVFCGTAVGPTSDRVRQYFAGPGNEFWSVLHRVGLTPRQLAPHEYELVIEFGIGLTDLAQLRAGRDPDLSSEDFDVEGLADKIQRFSPRALAFNGKLAAQIFLNHRVEYGRQRESVGHTAVFVLPSTSGVARRYWNEVHWSELAEFVA